MEGGGRRTAWRGRVAIEERREEMSKWVCWRVGRKSIEKQDQSEESRGDRSDGKGIIVHLKFVLVEKV